MSRFPNNASLIQFFAFFQTTLFFVANARKRIQLTVKQLSAPQVYTQITVEFGEDLAALLGEIIEARIRSRNLLNRLRNLP